MLPVGRKLVRAGIAVGVCTMLALGAAWAGPSSGGTWRQAIEAPGLGKLDAGGGAGVQSLSCASPGNCALAAPTPTNSSGAERSSSRRARATGVRRWPLPSTTRGSSEVTSVSCASPGNCGADGFFTDSSGNREPFVASERAGRWSKATDVPGLAALGRDASIGPLACPAPGNCVALAGTFVPERAGWPPSPSARRPYRWGKAVSLSGAKLRFTNLAQIFDISCPSTGDCTLCRTATGGPTLSRRSRSASMLLPVGRGRQDLGSGHAQIPRHRTR